MPKREHPSKTIDKVQAECKDRVHCDQVEDLDLVSVQITIGPPEEKCEHECKKEIKNDFCFFLHHILSSSFSPMSPVGLTKSIIISRTNAKASR